MTVKVLQGAEHLFLDGCHFDKDIHDKELIVNLNERWGHINGDFNENTNVLRINMRQGEVALTFSEQVKAVTLEYEEKDQLVFKIIK